MTNDFVVLEISLTEAKPVRLDVLRRGTPAREANYEGDDDPRTVHIGAERSGRVVATSTWLVMPWQNDIGATAVQLRGMAVLDEMQNSGVGRALIEAGVAHARTLGAHYVWAKARDSAIYFYERCGFAVVGEQFMEPASGMPHHLVVFELH
ncbi:MAG: GNAT family N-acetyltransferase [Actinomycetota bacterium]